MHLECLVLSDALQGNQRFFHSLEAAWTLISLEADSQTIAGALLHDTIEDTEATHKEIEDRFGSDVGTMVIGLTHSFQKLARAMANDYRVMLIKLADRHHNMLTLGFRRPSPARTAVAKETLDFYAPLAGQMGLEHIEYELRELAHMELGSSSTGPKQPNEQKLRTKLARILSEDETQAFFHQLTLYKPSRNLKAQITGYMQPSADVS